MLNFKVKQFVKIIMQNFVFPFFYQIGKILPIDKKLVIFADSHHDDVPYSMEDLYHWFESTDYKVLRLTKDCDNGNYISGLKFMIHFMLCYAKAGYVFLCDNFLPVASCNKREQTIVVQMWHAGGMLKKYAYDTPRDIPTYYKGNVFKNYSFILTSAKECNRAYVSGMRASPDIVKALGLSRTDRFYQDQYKDTCLKEFYTMYPEAKGKKIALWAPTFRGNASEPEIIDCSFIDRLRDQLGSEWFLVIKLHPHLQKHLKEKHCPIPTEKILPVADVLISDYSSVIYDYILLMKPIVFYVPDLEYLQAKDQFYIDYNEMPGQIVKNETELGDAVVHACERFDRDRMHQFKDKYMNACDGHALDRLVDYLQLS